MILHVQMIMYNDRLGGVSDFIKNILSLFLINRTYKVLDGQSLVALIDEQNAV